jgi:hypothetical protein
VVDVKRGAGQNVASVLGIRETFASSSWSAPSSRASPSRRLAGLGCPKLSLDERIYFTGLDQAASIEQFGFAQPRPDKLQAGDGNGLIIQGNRYRKCRISCKIDRNRVLQVQHAGFQNGYSPYKWNRWRQRLKSRQGDEINFFENLAESFLPLRPPP